MILIGYLLVGSYKPSNKIWRESNKQEFDDVGINKRNVKWNFMEYWNSIEMQIFKNPNSFLSKIYTLAHVIGNEKMNFQSMILRNTWWIDHRRDRCAYGESKSKQSES